MTDLTIGAIMLAVPLALMFRHLTRQPSVVRVYHPSWDRDFPQVVRCIAQGDIIGAHQWAGHVARRCHWQGSAVYFAARLCVKGW